MDVIYIDSLFMLNLIIDYLLLLSTGKICSLVLRRWRLLVSACIGGLYACAAVLAPNFFAMGTVKILMGALLTFIAYGKRRFLRTAICFFAVSAAFGGAIYAVTKMGVVQGSARLYIPVSMKVLAVSFAVCYALISLVFRQMGTKGEREVLDIKTSFCGRETSFKALRDTGNELCDPITGQSVLVASHEALSPLFSQAALGLLAQEDVLGAFERLSGMDELKGRMRIISFQSIGTGKALMICFRPDELSVSGKKTGDILIGISRTQLSSSGEYDAVMKG